MSFLSKMESKLKKMEKELKEYREKIKTINECKSKLPKSNLDFINKIWPEDSWNVDTIDRLHKQVPELLQKCQSMTKKLHEDFKQMVDNDSNLKSFIGQSYEIFEQSIINEKMYNELKLEIEKYNKQQEEKDIQNKIDLSLKNKYDSATEDLNKDSELLVFKSEKEFISFFKDNYNDYLEVQRDSYLFEEVHAYINNTMVQMDYDVEINTERDMNDNKFYSAGDLIYCKVELCDAEKYHKAKQKRKEDKIKALQKELEKLQS